MAELTLHFLGPLRIERAGARVEIDTRKALAALAYLAVGSPGGLNSRDHLATLLYPDYSQDRSRSAFRRTLSALRSGVGSDLIQADRETVSLALDNRTWCDVLRFQSLSDQCKSHGHAQGDVCVDCLPLLEQAAGLYSGDFMAGFSLRDSLSFDDWQFYQAENLRRECASVLERLVRGRGAQGRWKQAIELCHRWINLDPLHEPAHRRMMQLLAWSGQRTTAMRQYRECVRILDEELGVAPLAATTDLYHAIIEASELTGHEDAPDWRLIGHAPTAALPSGSTTAAQPISRDSDAQPPSLTMVGRAASWHTLLDHFQRASNGWLTVLEGEAGVGKTRLAEEFVAYAASQGAQVVQARCYEGDARLAYGPVVDALRAALAAPQQAARLTKLPPLWLSEVHRLAPEIAALHSDLAAPADLTGPGGQARFLEGIGQALLAVLAGDPPGIFFLDDLQWADQATLDTVAFLCRRLQGHPVLFLATLRADAGRSAEAARRLMAERGRAGHGGAVTLGRLSRDDVSSLLAQVHLPTSAQATTERLYRETEGLPLFLVEYLKALQEGTLTIRGEEWSMPATVQQVLQSRLDGVDQVGMQLLSTAAVIGRSFAYETLRTASGRGEEESVAGLERLAASGLVRELRDRSALAGEPLFDFSHEQVRHMVYNETSFARRRLLHRRVAEAMLRRPIAARDDADASQIAYHFRLAGCDQEAAAHYKLAGEHAGSVFANNDALEYFQAALALGHPEAAELHEATGDLLTLAGDYGRAVMAYETAASVNGRAGLARLEHKLGLVFLRQGEWELADSRFQAALTAAAAAAAADASPAWQAALLADWSLCAHRQDKPEEALELGEKALSLAKQADEPRALAQAHNVLGVLARSNDDLAAAGKHLEASLAVAERAGDLPAQIAALNNLALLARDQADNPRARALLETAIALCARLGDRHREAALHNNLADLWHEAGNQPEAMTHLIQAVQIFAQIGAQPSQAEAWQPEIWMLVEW